MKLVPLSLVLLIACNPSGPKDYVPPLDTVVDDDADGYTTGEGDCNDQDASINQDAAEVCDGVDNNCDGNIDEVGRSTWYADTDGDGFGDAASTVEDCVHPEGYTATGNDCDDQDGSIFPGAVETCNQQDDNCDGRVDEGTTFTVYADVDGDGFGDPASPLEVCSPPSGYVLDDSDCDDTEKRSFPGAAEYCDGRDNDCDSLVDEEAVDAETWYYDADGDGYGNCAAGVDACAAPPGYVAAVLSSDCDCNDGRPASYPGAPEYCNYDDDDCDGLTDENDSVDAADYYLDADGDAYGDPSSLIHACFAPGYVKDSTDCDDGNRAVNPGATEVCNFIDDNCDGTIDEAGAAAPTWYADTDGDAYGDPAKTTVSCTQPAGYVADSTDCDDAVATTNPGALEYCNGTDDDCDGTVDESDAVDASTWYRDGDSDTFGDPNTSVVSCNAPAGYVADNTDCDDTDPNIYPGAPETWYDGVDSDCDGKDDPSVCDSLPPDTTVAYDPTCTYAYSTAWSVTTDWTTDGKLTYSVGSTYTHVMATPVSGPLLDSNGDGLINEEDDVYLAYSTFTGSSYSSYGYLRVIAGDGSGELWSHSSATYNGTKYQVHATASVAMGDIDADGSPDLVTVSTGGEAMAFEADGTIKWVSSASSSSTTSVNLGDMDGDGQAEIILGKYILDSSGATVASGADCGSSSNSMADVDNDGTMELVCGGAVYEMTGKLVWEDTSHLAGRMVPVQLDSDSKAEFVQTYGGVFYAYDDNGKSKWTYNTGDLGGGSPVAADIDGDGWAEIAAGFETVFMVVDHTGAKVWSKTINDTTSRSGGTSAFDFNGDGEAELVYADQDALYVWSGAGTQRLKESNHASGTLYEFPTIADVDRDGNAEIVLASNDYLYSGWDGIHVLKESKDNWASARTFWNMYQYNPSSVDGDLLFPLTPSLPWLENDGWRLQDSWSSEPDGAPDVAAVLVGVCQNCAAGTAKVYVSVENLGSVFVGENLSVALYADNAGVRKLLSTQKLGRIAYPGDLLAPLEFTIALTDIGSSGLVAVVDDDGTGTGSQNECDETNNSDTWNEAVCP